jgi:hypothetical protein
MAQTIVCPSPGNVSSTTQPDSLPEEGYIAIHNGSVFFPGYDVYACSSAYYLGSEDGEPSEQTTLSPEDFQEITGYILLLFATVFGIRMVIKLLNSRAMRE